MRTVHVIGMIFDFTRYQPLKMTFAHDMPHHDVRDGISLALTQAGHDLWATPNSLHSPELIETLPADSPYRSLHVDRSFNARGEVIFLHLDRGVIMTERLAPEREAPPEQWLRFRREVVLA